jgi:hypothetical protein
MGRLVVDLDGMSVEPKKRSRAWIGWAVAALLLLAYAISIGPACRWADKSVLDAGDWAPWETVERVYAPFYWLSRHSQLAHSAIECYLNMWSR